MHRTAGQPGTSSAAATLHPAWPCLAALSVVLDLTSGQEEEKSQLTAAFAFELAAQAGLSPAQQQAAFMAGLLRHLGCTAFAAHEAQIAEDDIALRSHLIRHGGESALLVAAAVLRSNHTVAARMQALLQLGMHAPVLREHWLREACGAAQALAHRLGCDDTAAEALTQVYERWDGRGAPHGLTGDALCVTAQVTQAAHVAVQFSSCVDAVLGTWVRTPGPAAERAAEVFTQRELQVLRMLATGLTNKQIGRALGISDRTVQTHTLNIYQNIYQKLGVDTRAAATLAAAQQGWLVPTAKS